MEKFKIEELEKKIYTTLSKGWLDAGRVIEACDALVQKIQEGAYDDVLAPFLKSGLITEQDMGQVTHLICGETLRQKMETELLKDRSHAYPLGVLFHVNPENVEGIAAYSVIEGLLAGNINLVKLPSGDYGITEFLLRELMGVEPLLEEYIYLFSIRSGDEAMKMLASLADAIVVWGGDEAIKGIRAMAAPNQKVIEWGHKISFAYITNRGMGEENLKALAEHIILTKQTLCSSCQGIYLESSEKKVITAFCRKMLGYLTEKALNNPEYDMAWTAKSTLNCYTYLLEHRDVHALKGRGVNLIYCRDNELEPAIQYGTLWVKSLGREQIIPTLKKHHGYLQTVGLLCGEEEGKVLAETWIKAGVTDVRGAADISSVKLGDSHDGEYPLRRYTKVVL